MRRALLGGVVAGVTLAIVIASRGGAGAGGGDGRRRSGRGQRGVDRTGRHAPLHGLHQLLLLRRAARAGAEHPAGTRRPAGLQGHGPQLHRSSRDRSGRRPCGSSPHCRSRPRPRCSRSSRATPRSASSWPGCRASPPTRRPRSSRHGRSASSSAAAERASCRTATASSWSRCATACSVRWASRWSNRTSTACRDRSRSTRSA